MRRVIGLLIVMLLLAAPLTLVVAQDSNTLVRVSNTDIDHWNSVTQTLVVSSIAQSYIYPRLWWADPTTGLPDPERGVATWEISEDGLTYTWTIRDNANWSDGTPVTAHDVAWTFLATRSDKVQTTRSSWFDNVEAFNIVDDKTLEIVYKKQDCDLWTSIGLPIMPKHKFAEDYSDFMDNAFNQFPDVSGGPYILDEWRPDEFIRYHANPDYYNGKPNIENLVLKVVVDNEVRKQALKAGELDFININPDEIEEFADDPNINIYVNPLNSWFNFIMNHADPTNPQPGWDADGNRLDQGHHPLFGDVRVRQAIAMGWNKDDVVALIGEGSERVIGTVTPSIPWAYNFDIEPWQYDPEGAAALLEEAGWIDQDGDGVRECHGCMYAEEGTPFVFQFDYPTTNSVYDNTAALIQDQLAQLGIQADIRTWEFPALASERLYPQIYDAFLVSFTWSQPTPHPLTDVFLNSRNDNLNGGLNFTSYYTPEMDQLIADAVSVPGCAIEERAPIYYEIQRKIHDEVISDFVATNVSVVATRSRLQNVTFGSWGSNPFEEWTLAE